MPRAPPDVYVFEAAGEARLLYIWRGTSQKRALDAVCCCRYTVLLQQDRDAQAGWD